MKNIKTIIQ